MPRFDPIQLLLQNASSACRGLEFLSAAVALEELCGGVRPGVGKGSVGSAATWLGNKRPSRAAARAQGSAGDHLPGEERQFLPCPSFFTLCEKLFVAGGEPLLPTSLLLPRKQHHSSQDFILGEITQPQSMHGPQRVCAQGAHASGSCHATAILGFAQEGVQRPWGNPPPGKIELEHQPRCPALAQ